MNVNQAPTPPEPMLQFFGFSHLPPHLQATSAGFQALAEKLLALPRNPERTAAFRKLLEAKDCAVRAMIYRAQPPRVAQVSEFPYPTS